MFDAPVDTWYVWVGLALVATAAAGTANQFPTAPPPDARAAAAAVDRAAAADHGATARHPIDAEAVKLGRTHLALRDDGRTSRTRFAWPVTPVRRGSPLWRVLLGVPPDDVFGGVPALREAVEEARNDTARWRRAERLVARTITWEDLDVTLVGA